LELGGPWLRKGRAVCVRTPTPALLLGLSSTAAAAASTERVWLLGAGRGVETGRGGESGITRRE
jgi:hypothetical protein